MEHSRRVHAFLVWAILALSSFASSQSSSSWAIDEPIVSGTTTLSGKMYQQTPSGPIVVDQVWTRAWGSGQWHLNGTPVAFAPSQPFGDPVTDLHTVSAVSVGTVTLRIRWVGEGPHPSIVTVNVRSTATCEFTQSSGYGSVNNGISGAQIVDILDDTLLRRTQSSRTTHQLPVVNGIAELTLTKAANAGALTGYSIGRVWADAEPSQMNLKVANVLVELNGIQYHKKPLPDVLQHQIIPMSNPHHDVFVPNLAGAVTLQWNAAIPKIAEAILGTNSNHDYYWVSGSVKPYYWTAGLDWHAWSGHAATHTHIHPHYERYVWSPGPSGSSSTGGPAIPDQTFYRTPHSFMPVVDPNYRSAQFMPGDMDTETVSLVYQWGLGASNCLCGFYPPHWSEEAHREAAFGLPYDLVADSGVVISVKNKKTRVYFEGMGYRVPAGVQYNNSLTGFVITPLFNTTGAIALTGHAVDVAGLIDTTFARSISGTAALTGVAIEMYRSSLDPIPNVQKYTNNHLYSWWNVNGAWYEEPPTDWEQTKNLYEWEADIRPLSEITAKVFDRYGPNGYIGRNLVLAESEIRAHNGIELRRYYYGTSGGPGGGGGSGGGS